MYLICLLRDKSLFLVTCAFLFSFNFIFANKKYVTVFANKMLLDWKNKYFGERCFKRNSLFPMNTLQASFLNRDYFAEIVIYFSINANPNFIINANSNFIINAKPYVKGIPNLFQTGTPTQAIILTLKKVNKKCADKYS